MTLITFDEEGNPTIKMTDQDVLPIATITYLDSIDRHLFDYSMFQFRPIEAVMSLSPSSNPEEFRSTLIEWAGTSSDLVKITDYTVVSLHYNYIRLAGTGIDFEPDALKNWYVAFKKLKELDGGVLHPLELRL